MQAKIGLYHLNVNGRANKLIGYSLIIIWIITTLHGPIGEASARYSTRG